MPDEPKSEATPEPTPAAPPQWAQNLMEKYEQAEREDKALHSKIDSVLDLLSSATDEDISEAAEELKEKEPEPVEKSQQPKAETPEAEKSETPPPPSQPKPKSKKGLKLFKTKR